MPLLDLPLEILQMVFSYITQKEYLLRLCEACPRLYPSILPYLWRSLEIITRKDDKDAPIIDRGQAHHLQESAGLLNRLRYIREVNVKYAYDIPVELFCHAVGPWREDHHNRILWRRFKLPTKSRGSLLEVLQMVILHRNYLPGILLMIVSSWEVTHCTPKDILSPLGYLPLRQQELETLHLIVNSYCWQNREWAICLSSFKKLKRLSFFGVQASDYCSVREMLQTSSDRLSVLELYAPMRVRSFEPTPRDLFGFDATRPKPSFPRLQTLALAGISFEGHTTSFLQTIDISSLSSLNLRSCTGLGLLLKEILETKQPVSLKLLEIHCRSTPSYSTNLLSDFLKFCGKLEYFSHGCRYRDADKTLEFWRIILENRLTLKRLSFHHDMVSVRSFQRDAESLLSDKNPFWLLDLECLGLCCTPDYALEVFLSPFIRKTCLRVIHFRSSKAFSLECQPNQRMRGRGDDDVTHFLNWAFGATGIRSLQFVAFGDFSPQYRYLLSNHYYFRVSKDSLSYKVRTPECSRIQWDEFCEKYSDFLGAWGSFREPDSA